jgi:hypothetical protein
MKQVEIEISARVTFNQVLILSDEDAQFLKDHEGYSANAYFAPHRELFTFVEPKLDFDCISSIDDIDLEIVDILEEEEDDSN